MSGSGGDLATRFRERILRRAGWADDDTVVVAASGGLDSTVLLHLLRFTAGLPRPTLVVAHLDHAMRSGSEDDALWLRGLSRVWDLPFRTDRLVCGPANEADARHARYRFLEEVRGEADATAVLTAHQADDQAETVLFRAVRGTGIGGLRGIRERRAPAIWRPLLPFWREEIEAYAIAAGLSWREDPSNRRDFSRNVLRNSVLPALEASVAPGARRSLARLSRRAREDEAAWRSVLPGLLGSADPQEEPDGVSVDRESFLRLHAGVRGRLVRALARRFGAVMSEAGTRRAVEFTRAGASGSEVLLGPEVALRRDLDRLRVGPRGPVPGDEPGRIPDTPTGETQARIGGRRLTVSWSRRGSGTSGEQGFDGSVLHYPLVVRGWQPGDSVRMPYGVKKLKKLFLEARIRVPDRVRTPVLVGADGTVLWVPGVARSTAARPGHDAEPLFIRIIDADSD